MKRSSRSQKGFLESLFRRLLSERYGEAVVGDFREIYEERIISRGRLRARIWLFFHVISSLVVLTRKQFYGSLTMFKSYFQMAFRNLKKQKAFTLINIIGLAVGLSATILILLFLQFEMSFDRFHSDKDRLYRVSIDRIKDGKIEYSDHVYTPPIGKEMMDEFPEVEDFVRLNTRRIAFLNVDGEMYREDGIRHVSSRFFKMFSFKLLKGDPGTALEKPFSIVLSEGTAHRIFGTDNPLGEAIQIRQNLYTITGVVEAPPENSTIQFSSLISFSTLYEIPDTYMGWNGGNQYVTYVKLGEMASAVNLEEKLPDFMWTRINEKSSPNGWLNVAHLHPLKKLHFFHDASSRTALINFYTFSAVALFILLIACINFINLTTARAARRAREVGLRKVIGAHKGNLIRQFLGESIVLTFVAFVVGLGLVFLLNPVYSQLLNKKLDFLRMINPASILFLAGLILAVGVISGIYPAFYLSSYQPIKTLKGIFDSGRGKKRFRNALVIFQFMISVALIICTFLIHNQMRYIKGVDLGYQKENILMVRLSDRQIRSRTDEIHSELRSVPGVVQVTASSAVPHRGFTGNGYRPEGYKEWLMYKALDVDEHFFEMFEIPIVQGRNFSKEFPTDKEAYIINETLARKLEWIDPVGKTIFRHGEWPVVGVVKDFQFATLHDEIEPLIISFNSFNNNFSLVSVKINTSEISRTVDAIEKVFKKFSPLFPFEYSFLDDAFDTLYRTEERFQRIFLYFSCLAICIALLGLFSLSAYSAQQKSKEIGIRKVLGATVPNILSIFSREMVILIALANAVAWPLSFYLNVQWQNIFAYKAPFTPWIYILAFGGSLVAALITISFQSLKAALRDPVNELRSE